MSASPKPANDTERAKILAAMRVRRIYNLAAAFPSDELRAAAELALERELRSIPPKPFEPQPCDECIK